MSNLKSEINDDVLDELVTGSLRGERYRALLEALEARPHLWRKCALAFLQEQAITQDLKALSHGDIDWSPETELSAPAASSLRPTSEPAVELPPRTAAPDSAEQKVLLQRLAVLAALLVISFTVGWLGAVARDGGVIAPPAGASSNAGVFGGLQTGLPAGSGAALPKPGSPPSELLPGGREASPTVFASDQVVPIDLELPPQLRELELAGKIRIETVDALMPVQLDDGRSFLVPVQHFRVVPVVYSY